MAQKRRHKEHRQGGPCCLSCRGLRERRRERERRSEREKERRERETERGREGERVEGCRREGGQRMTEEGHKLWWVSVCTLSLGWGERGIMGSAAAICTEHG